MAYRDNLNDMLRLGGNDGKTFLPWGPIESAGELGKKNQHISISILLLTIITLLSVKNQPSRLFHLFRVFACLLTTTCLSLLICLLACILPFFHYHIETHLRTIIAESFKDLNHDPEIPLSVPVQEALRVAKVAELKAEKTIDDLLRHMEVG